MPAFERKSPPSAGTAAVPNAEDASVGDVRGERRHRSSGNWTVCVWKLNGSVCASPLSDAKAALAGRDYQNAAGFVGNTWELYRQRRWQVLRHHPENSGALSAEDRYLAAAKVKAEGILRRLEAVLDGLRKLAAAQPESEPAGFTPSAGLLAEYSAAKGGDVQLQVILKYFAVRPVSAEQDLSPGALYCLQSRGEHFLLQCTQRTHAPETVSFNRLLTGKPLAPVPLQLLLEQARKGRLRSLSPLEGAEAAGSKPETRRADSKVALIDIGSFTQLLTAAQRTEFGVNTDAIISARDRDFRRGEYRKAYGVIEGLSKRFDTAAEQRKQTLAQEDVAYHSGVLKMSPKEWQAKAAPRPRQHAEYRTYAELFQKTLKRPGRDGGPSRSPNAPAGGRAAALPPMSRALYALTYLTAFPFVSHEINKHAVLQIHTEASKP